MDRTGWIVVTICSGLLVYWMLFMTPEPQPRPLPTEPGVSDTQKGDGNSDTPIMIAASDDGIDESIVELRSDGEEGKGVLFRFSNKGGGVLTVDLLEHWVTLEQDKHVQLNQFDRPPIGSLLTGAAGPRGRELQTYTIESQSDSEIVYVATRPDGIQVRKRYFLNRGESEDKDSESHLLHCEITLHNPAGEGRQAANLGNFWFYGGSIAPMLPRGTMYTGFYYKDRSMTYKPIGFLNKFMLRPERIEYIQDYSNQEKQALNWGGASNQFYAMVVQDPNHESSGFWVRKFDMLIEGMEAQSARARTKGLECAVALPAELLEPGETTTVSYNIYTGPKEYARLNQLPDGQRDLMAYGKIPVMGPLFGWIIKPFSELLVQLLVFIHNNLIPSFGVAILILTVLVRALIWPVHSRAHKVSKQMSQLTPKIQELKEKYPDDPQKLQQEQMKLWGDYGINPVGGCLPALIQLPIFLGYFRMLSSAEELRHVPFLWIDDLSMPDTLFHVFGLPVNLLPIIMTATSYLQFSMMPKTGDKNQQMIFKFMPLMFLVFCYNYASALALYWTWQNIISMGQTYVLNKREIPELKKKPRKKTGKKSFMERLQDQAEAARQAQEQQKRGGGGGGAKKSPGFNALPSTGPKSTGNTSPNFGERGPRKQKPKSSGSGKNRRKKKR